MGVNPVNVDALMHAGPGADPGGFVKDVVLAILQKFFYDHTEFTFSYDDEQTKIRIADIYAENLKKLELRPAVLAKREDLRWRQVAINQFLTQSGPSMADKFTDILDSRLTLNCVAREGLEAERLAGIVFMFFTQFRNALRQLKFVHEISLPAMGSEFLAEVDSTVDTSVVPVVINISINVSWALVEAGPVLQAINVTNRLLGEGQLHFEDITPTDC
jgi:hypothetical protein